MKNEKLFSINYKHEKIIPEWRFSAHFAGGIILNQIGVL